MDILFDEDFFKSTTLGENGHLLKASNDLIKNDPVQDKHTFNGINIDIEWPSGSVRSWAGSPYRNPMKKVSYGYIRDTNSEDGEEVDVYLRENPLKNAKVYRLSQLDGKGNFDEHKFGLGFQNEKEFKTAYCNAMPKKMCGSIDTMTMKKFKEEIVKFYTTKSLKEGIKIEKEHKNLAKIIRKDIEKDGKLDMTDKEIYKFIAQAHIKEDEDYYPKLKKYVEGHR